MTGSRSGVQPAHARKLQLQLTALNTASYLGDIAKFESWGLHSLKADMIEKSSISVSGNWRIVFEFYEDDVQVVDYRDYH